MASRRNKRTKIRQLKRYGIAQSRQFDKRLEGILATTQGGVRERMILDALEKNKPSWLNRARKATYQEDCSGIDIIIEHKTHGVIPLQCKSSGKGIEKHKSRGKKTPFIRIKAQNSPKTIVEKVEKAVKWAVAHPEVMRPFRKLRFEI